LTPKIAIFFFFINNTSYSALANSITSTNIFSKYLKALYLPA
jgi:hypothetical protein